MSGHSPYLVWPMVSLFVLALVFFGRPGQAPPTSHHRAEDPDFAKQLEDRLANGLRHGAYTALVLVAPPRFLGRLKTRLDSEVAKSLVQAVDKNYTRCGVAGLRERLGELIHGSTALGN